MNMKSLLALLAALLLIWALPVQAMAGDSEAPEPEGGSTGTDAGEALPPEQAEASGSIFDLLDGSTVTVELDMAAYYLGEMSKAAAAGDLEAGRQAEQYRNEIIDQTGGDQVKISFDDLYLLAKLIYAEAGSDWLNDSFRFCVGEVVMNRVDSPEFPNTVYDVVYQKGQYTSAGTAAFTTLVPSQACVDVAVRLMQGERQMAPSVVFQSDHEQGEIFSMYTDRRLGTTFFCVSPNQDLYPIPEG